MSRMNEKYRLLNNSDKQAPEKYRNTVFYTTFIAYANTHLTRKCYTNVKVQLLLAGFSVNFLSQIDATFMIFYSLGAFYAGHLCERFHTPTLIGLGLIGSGICAFIFACGIWTDFISQQPFSARAFFLGISVIHGWIQSTAAPANSAVMDNWFGVKNRGYIFGAWTCHQYVGNMSSALFVSTTLMYGLSWTWALLIPSVFSIFWGVICINYIPEKPEHVGIELHDVSNNGLPLDNGFEDGGVAVVSIWDAFMLPNVISYSIALGFFKLVNYTLFFWLPFFLSRSLGPVHGNLASILFDLGMMPGAVVVSHVSGWFGGRRACVVAVFMGFLVPFLVFFSVLSDNCAMPLLLTALTVMGVLVGGPASILTSAVAVELSEHPSINGDSKSLSFVTDTINFVASILAALGLLSLGPLQVAYGWTAVWRLLILSTVAGTVLISPQVYREIVTHDNFDSPTPIPTSRASFEEEKA